MKSVKNPKGNVWGWLAVIVMVAIVVYAVIAVFRDDYKAKVTLHLLDEVPKALMLVQDATTTSPKAMIFNLDDGMCIPKSCQLENLKGLFELADLFSDDGGTKPVGNNTPMSIGLQIRMFKPMDTSAMQGSLPAFQLVALSQMDTDGFPTGLHILSSDFVDKYDIPQKAPIDFLGYWKSIGCYVSYLGTSIPCDKVGYYPEENGFWVFPIQDPKTAPSTQVYVLKMNSKGGIWLFPFESDGVTAEDVKYIAEKNPAAKKLLKLFYSAQVLFPSIP